MIWSLSHVTVYIEIDSKVTENTPYLTLGIIQCTTDCAPNLGGVK